MYPHTHTFHEMPESGKLPKPKTTQHTTAKASFCIVSLPPLKYSHIMGTGKALPVTCVHEAELSCLIIINFKTTSRCAMHVVNYVV